MTMNRPSNFELVEAVREFLSEEVLPAVEQASVTYKLRIALNVLGIVERQCELRETHSSRESALLRDLMGSELDDPDELNHELCRRIREGQFDQRQAELVQTLSTLVKDKLAIDNPRYSTYLASNSS